ALAAVDKVMIINEGRVQAFGARDVVLPQLATQPPPAPPAAKEPALKQPAQKPAFVEAAE
ncbi:MAG: hypothetical protein OTI36_18450, partial [Beijerinckiaceae bacterium]|nr:hypothetical protein [Beijerinckiaceae bacterium]